MSDLKSEDLHQHLHSAGGRKKRKRQKKKTKKHEISVGQTVHHPTGNKETPDGEAGPPSGKLNTVN